MFRLMLNYFLGIPTKTQVDTYSKVSEYIENETSKLVKEQRKELDFIERHDLLKLKCDLIYAREYATTMAVSSEELNMKISEIKQEYFANHSRHLEKYLNTQEWYVGDNT
ncbi:hypothetical protein ACPV40_14800 [Vibrio alfacsensis]|uniref:hypothetical protein n=1 Tax=Vibrio alfacsensis TaxID=1074311 RepID=UPI004068DEA3